MKTQKVVKMAAAALLTLGMIALTGRFSTPPSEQAQDNHQGKHKGDSESSLVRIGFEIAPVPLNLAGKDQAMVGLGSYLVNAVGDCNGCHTGGGPPNFNYAAGRNPYFGQPKEVDPTVYLSGGQNFGPVGTPTGPAGYSGPFMIARNLTPNYAGLPE